MHCEHVVSIEARLVLLMRVITYLRPIAAPRTVPPLKRKGMRIESMVTIIAWERAMVAGCLEWFGCLPVLRTSGGEEKVKMSI